ncbi:MAG TPA: FAD/NAD(P)-binding oxidoreductase [Flavobacterium sp.]|jgi:sulfide:quinone oxidoreductase|nr:FAD/NAD(P)-binding oxidoreductase [Flavobacterium sp.]HPJ10885.1 FAD/NAD(P)-binding oxidoreductase [Flavobacterium sp.]
MKTSYQIVIVGGGNAGISVASQLLRKNNALDIVIIDPAEKHYYQPAWTLVGAGIFDIRKTVRKQKDLIPKNVSWIKEKVETFDPENNKVHCSGGKTIDYAYLIVCPGIQLDWAKIKGGKETLAKTT